MNPLPPSFKESHIEGGRVEVDKLEDEHLEDEGIVILGLCSVHLCNRENKDTVLQALCTVHFQIIVTNSRFN